ncbi:acetyl-CoA carboxylase biotin carboxyl carrier protein [Desulfitibacter alkalitolerans]|uniref:acetyl-CoA carboxylase biotin carboxyl carrier protein n=1 Tax=Desulfitibacter alkalitolerans TaxID=264641 RepID=UPI000488EA6C|nr:acetyl-CoA carboxylase biotin carboxyl carrier protein [Desulfitibacter alkalitolerans]
MEIKDIKDLILTIDKTSIETVEIEKSDIKIKINKKLTNENSNWVKPTVEKLKHNMAIEEIETDTNERKSEVDIEYNNLLTDDEDIYIVKSPIVGTFYGAPSPDAPPFVKVGDKVEQGQTLCIVEAMKMMNGIECEVAGEIIDILTKDGDIVEYGQPLMRIGR